MKFLTYISMSIAMFAGLTACNKEPDYPKGVVELEHHYYALFVPNNNTAVTVTRSQAAIVKFPVQFYSTYVRGYDVVAKYRVTTTDISTPALLGVDYAIVDKNGAPIPSADSTFSIVFPQAKQAMDTIYLKLLNNTTPGVRKMEVQLLDNVTSEFEVDFFSTAFRRPVTIN